MVEIKKKKESKSYGIICCRRNSNNKQYEILFIKKRNTYAFMSFTRGIYDKDYDVIQLLNKMTVNEKYILLSLDFKLIWKHCFSSYDETHRDLKKDGHPEPLSYFVKESNNLIPQPTQ